MDRARPADVAHRRRAAGYRGSAGQRAPRHLGEDGHYARRRLGTIAARPVAAEPARAEAADGDVKSMRSLLFLTLGVTAWAQQYVISTVAGGAPPATPLTATRASIGDPSRVAADAAGNVYFSSLHAVFKVDANGTL